MKQLIIFMGVWLTVLGITHPNTGSYTAPFPLLDPAAGVSGCAGAVEAAAFFYAKIPRNAATQTFLLQPAAGKRKPVPGCAWLEKSMGVETAAPVSVSMTVILCQNPPECRHTDFPVAACSRKTETNKTQNRQNIFSRKEYNLF